MDNIRQKMAHGALWMVGVKLVERSLGLVSTLVLARILLPQDFGVVAMAMSFVALLELSTAFGFDVALIQKQTQKRDDWNTAFTFNVLLGLAVAGAMVAFAPAVASYYRHPELEDVVRALAIGSAVQGFENIGIVAFRSEMRFDREFRFQIAKKLISFGITIPAAILLDSYWALVIGQTISRIAGVSLSYWLHPYRPSLTLAAASNLLGFSKWLLIVNVLGYLKERSPDWIIGRISGPAGLGLFNISMELAAMPSTELVAPINRAVFPAYAKLADDRPRLRTEYLSVMAVITLIAVPAIAGLGATAPLLVPVVLGPNWVEAGPLLTLLAFYGLTQIIQSNAQAVYLALGRPDVPAKVNAAHALVKIALMTVMTAQFGLIGAAVGNLVTACVMIPVALATAFRLLDIRTSQFWHEVWRPFTAALAMFGVVLAYVQTAGAGATGLQALVHLAVAVTLGVVLYVSGIVGLWMLRGRPEGSEAVVLRKIAPILRKVGIPIPSSP